MGRLDKLEDQEYFSLDYFYMRDKESGDRDRNSDRERQRDREELRNREEQRESAQQRENAQQREAEKSRETERDRERQRERDRSRESDTEKSINEMERERSLNITERFEHRRARPLVYAMSRLFVNLSYAIVGALVLSLLVQAFAASAEVGVKSLAAAALPPLVITYLTLFTRLLRPQDNIPDIALFLASAVWIIAMLLLVDFLKAYPGNGLPFGVFALSLTLSGLIFINKYVPFSSVLSNAFGIVVGVLIYTLVFGITYRT